MLNVKSHKYNLKQIGIGKKLTLKQLVPWIASMASVPLFEIEQRRY